MKKISKSEFLDKIYLVKEVTSKKGIPYISINIDGGYIRGIRDNGRSNSFSINIDKLYSAYLHLDTITTSTLKKYVPGVQSPSYAILAEIDLIQ